MARRRERDIFKIVALREEVSASFPPGDVRAVVTGRRVHGGISDRERKKESEKKNPTGLLDQEPKKRAERTSGDLQLVLVT